MRSTPGGGNEVCCSSGSMPLVFFEKGSLIGLGFASEVRLAGQ